jgi:hypothetical protein
MEEFHVPNLKIPYEDRLGFYFIIPRRTLLEKLQNKSIYACGCPFQNLASWLHAN